MILENNEHNDQIHVLLVTHFEDTNKSGSNKYRNAKKVHRVLKQYYFVIHYQKFIKVEKFIPCNLFVHSVGNKFILTEID